MVSLLLFRQNQSPMKMKTLHKKDLSIWVVESHMISPFAFILTALLYLGIDGQNTVWKASTRLLVSRTEKKKKKTVVIEVQALTQ